MWKNARFGIFIPMLIIIRPSWLRVERAIIFFISHSVIALRPAINMVVVPIIKIICLNMGRWLRKLWNRISKNTPAVTRVEEWTRALTGVGAAIAAGNHLEKGIWALFVIAATIISMICRVIRWVGLLVDMFKIYQ